MFYRLIAKELLGYWQLIAFGVSRPDKPATCSCRVGQFLFFFDSVLCPFQDYFTHRDEPIDRWAKRENPGKTT